MHTIYPTCKVSQTPEQVNHIRFLGLENAREPILRFQEPKIVVRDPHFCVLAYLLSRRTASEQSACLKASL